MTKPEEMSSKTNKKCNNGTFIRGDPPNNPERSLFWPMVRGLISPSRKTKFNNSNKNSV
jgi:hypothetical protein